MPDSAGARQGDRRDQGLSTLADELVAIGAMGFLLSSMLAYSAMKQVEEGLRQRLGRTADGVFSASQGLLLLVCVIIAFRMV